jgi:hypothetical protein
MYAVVRRYDGVTDPAEAGRLVKEGFVPLLREVPGFVAYYWVNSGDRRRLRRRRWRGTATRGCFTSGESA